MVKLGLLEAGAGEFSDLVEELLTEWLRTRKPGPPRT